MLRRKTKKLHVLSGKASSNRTCRGKKEARTSVPPSNKCAMSTTIYKALVTAMSYIEQQCIGQGHNLPPQLYCIVVDGGDDNASGDDEKCKSIMLCGHDEERTSLSIGDFGSTSPSIVAASVV